MSHAPTTPMRSVGDPALDIPSSVEQDGGDLFGLNARFTTPPSPTTTYDIVRVER